MFRYADEMVDKPYMRETYKPVLKFNLNKELVHEYVSCSSAAKSMEVPSYKIYKAAVSKSHYFNDFLWMYKEDYENFGFNN